jgi:hypothetical protein
VRIGLEIKRKRKVQSAEMLQRLKLQVKRELGMRYFGLLSTVWCKSQASHTSNKRQVLWTNNQVFRRAAA